VVPLSEMTVEQFRERLAAFGGNAPAHAARLLRAYYRTGGHFPGEETPAGAPTHPPLPRGLVSRIRAEIPAMSTVESMRQRSSDGTVKLLRRLADGRTVECVFLPDHRDDRAAGCLSSQVGCAMGCDFCATAQGGLQRNLTSGEIVEQALALRREAAAAGRRLHTLVFMGMGEPLHNLEAVLAAVRRLGDSGLGGFGWRQITVSTVGIVPGIDALCSSGVGVQLAISLHAPDDATRARLLPPGRRFGVGEVLAAADRYLLATGRPVILQYCLLRGVNDSPGHAARLAELVRGRRMHVNLLTWNPAGPGPSGNRYSATTSAGMDAFLAVLRDAGCVAHVRRSRGPDIDAACGQLRRREEAALP
jgi:23S rRNA (adenine2503-C2)-methyltransferase